MAKSLREQVLPKDGLTKFHRRELNERDMLLDAPPYYSPQWLDCLAESPLKDQLKSQYVDARKELQAKQKRGVSLTQDLLLRRVIYNDRIMTRCEYAMEYWTWQQAQGHADAENMLMKYALIYTGCTQAMVSCLKALGLDGKPARAGEEVTFG